MKQEDYDALIAEREDEPEWPNKAEAAAYLAAKGYDGTASGAITLPSVDHKPTAKQLRCLKVLGVKATPPTRAMQAEAGKVGVA